MKLPFIYCVLLLLFGLSCKRKTPCEPYESKVYTFKLEDTNKVQFPYKKVDTLIFVNQDGDTAILRNTKIENYYASFTDRGINPECPQYDYRDYECVQTIYNGTNPSFNRLDVKVCKDWEISVENPRDGIIFNINDKYKFVHGCLYYFDSTNYTFPIQFRGQTVYGVSKVGFKDPTRQIIFYKNEGLIAFYLNNSNVYIKQ